MSDDNQNKSNPEEVSGPEKKSEPETISELEKRTGQEHITVKKSTYNKLIIGITSALIVVAFFTGYTLGSQTVEPLVIQQSPQPNITPQPTQAPPTEQTRIFVSLSDDPVKGNPNAPVTIVEFSDFQCPFCARFFAQTLPQIQQDYIDSGKVKLVFRDFPIESIHANAKAASIAAECADDQNMFWQYHDRLFEGQTQWARLSANDAANTFKQYATELGLNSENFDSCFTSTKYSDEINEDFQNGANYGVTGTPAFFIGNDKDGYVILIGAKPYSAFQQVIDNELS
ncbi:MAG TPA: DsbA family protein [Nitrosopumilaceae archaeon]|nr:DsbA family protein [Nitrosopumilaceae archaeon]